MYSGDLLILLVIIMPFINLNDKHFTAEQKTAILETLDQLETLMQPGMVELTPEERTQYGSVNEQNKLVINKVWDFRNNQGALSCPDINWEDFENDYESRRFLENFLARVDKIRQGTMNSKILFDWDNFQATLMDYDYTKYKNSNGVYGYEKKAADLRQFFGGRPAVPKTTPENPLPPMPSEEE